MLEKGQVIDVKILSIDPNNEKISIGLKQLDNDPWQAVVESTPIGAHVEVEIAKLVSFGAFARLTSGIEGLIHVSELSRDRVQKPEDIVSVGQMVTAKVISIDPVERKIGLSIREYQRDQENAVQASYSKSGADVPRESVSIGETVGSAVPQSLLQAGRTLTDAANELMASVNAAPAPAPAAEPAAEKTETPAAE
jgi:small subunit ribosomal protein S1